MNKKLIFWYFLAFNIYFLQVSLASESILNKIEMISLDKIPKRIPSHVIVNTSFTQEDLEELSKRNDIKSLDLRTISSNLAPLAIFRSSFTSVRELYIGRISFIEQILEALPKCMPFLEKLVLDSPTIESSVLHHLHSLSSLKTLKLLQTHVTETKHIESLLNSNSSLTIYLNSSNFSILNVLNQSARIKLET